MSRRWVHYPAQTVTTSPECTKPVMHKNWYIQYSVTSLKHRYGEIVNINLARDQKTGKPKGYCFLGYKNQRSTALAVDNFNGIKVNPLYIAVLTAISICHYQYVRLTTPTTAKVKMAACLTMVVWVACASQTLQGRQVPLQMKKMKTRQALPWQSNPG